jgi:hypothetical protein
VSWFFNLFGYESIEKITGKKEEMNKIKIPKKYPKPAPCEGRLHIFVK